MRALTAFLLPLSLAATLAFAQIDVRAHGAKGDGATNDTAALQRAIDAAAQAGGATVHLPPGRYLSGTLHLRNRSHLHLAPGATLAMHPDDSTFAPYEPPPTLLNPAVTRYLFSTRGIARNANLPPTEDDSETTYFRYALLLAENVSAITLDGPGTIDGNRTTRGGPKPIAFKNTRHATIRDLSITNAPNYAISLLAADFTTIDNVRILNAFADGIDPDSSHHVRIANSYIDSWDDAICPKASLALGRRRSTEHLTVTNSILRTACSAFKFGTESAGDLRHVTVSNLTILPRENSTRLPIAGIALESVDGANIEAVTISNITMRDVRTPLFLRLGARGRGMATPTPGSLRGIVISNIIATGATLASSLTAVPGSALQDITLDNIHITSTPAPGQPGPGQPTPNVPEEIAKYPEATMFGDLPAAHLYIRRANALTATNLRLRTTTPTARPSIILDQVRDATLTGAIPTLKTENSESITVNGKPQP